MRRAIVLVAFAHMPLPALAGTVDTPQCRADLPRAQALIEAVAARDRQGPISDNARLCAVLRRNSADMRGAAEILNRCLTGHERGENVGQLVASVEDVNAVIARRCR
jgi:hypothetical protein